MRKLKSFKLVVFIPLSHLAKVRSAICAAGAGRLGRYDHCTFHSIGTETFRPLKGSRPFKGAKGKLSRAKEARLETVVPAIRLKAVLKALRQSHPYEEISFDLYQLAMHNGGKK